MSRGLHSTIEAKERADKFMTGLAVGAGHGLLRRAAIALSASHIFPALRAVNQDRLGNGFALIRLSISMDHQRGGIDIDQLVKESESLRKSGYVSLLFQMFINDFLMTYRIPVGPRERLVKEFGLTDNKKALPTGGLAQSEKDRRNS
ncbi:MAG: hypothetical protein Q8N23_32615 [Archangium sp.]|nr:hypothetical protein [Archangium sp.]MDP3572157.1 hypothetical protein [Archangium sp.]